MVKIKSSRDSISGGGREGILPHPAHGADPVFGDVLKGGARFDTAVGVPRRGIVNIPAYVAYILFHLEPPCPFIILLLPVF
jgi:hypothetical protein